MEKNCLYCDTSFSTNRGSKKYCNDNCKQLAYLKRCGMVRSGHTHNRQGLNYQPSTQHVGSIPVKDDTSVVDVKPVKDVNDVNYGNYSQKDQNVNDGTADILSAQVFNRLLRQITEATEKQLSIAIERIRQEFRQNSTQNRVAPEADKTDLPVDHPQTAIRDTTKPCPPCFNGLVRYGDDVHYFQGNGETLGGKIINFRLREPTLQKTKSETGKIPVSVNPHLKIYSPAEDDESDRDDERNDYNEEIDSQTYEPQEVDWKTNRERKGTNTKMQLPDKIQSIDFPEEEEKGEEEKDHEDAAPTKAEPGIDQSTAYIKELEEKLRIARLKADPLKLNADNEQPSRLESKTEAPYKWVESKLLRHIEKHQIDTDVELKFRYPRLHWDTMDAMSISWVNVRLRCLVENLIRASNIDCVGEEPFCILTDAFIALVKSPTYASLPENYPYTELIHELAVKLNRMKKSNFKDRIKVQFSLPRKAELLAIRQQLLTSTIPIRFSDLHFLDERDYYDAPGEKVSKVHTIPKQNNDPEKQEKTKNPEPSLASEKSIVPTNPLKKAS